MLKIPTRRTLPCLLFHWRLVDVRAAVFVVLDQVLQNNIIHFAKKIKIRIF